MAEDPRTFKTFIALLAACRENGIAYVSAIYLKTICHMTEATIQRALEKLESPDPSSRSLVDDGRRIQRVDGGFRVINYQVYREVSIRDAEAERKRVYRAKKGWRPGQSRTVQGPSASASASASSSKEGGKGGEEGFNNFWAIYLRRVGKADAISAWNAIDKKDHAAVTVAAINYMKSVIKLKTEIQYIKHPATFLRKDRWKDYAFEGKGALAGVTGREGCQYIAPTTEKQIVEKKLRAEYDERLKAFMKDRGYKTEEEIPIDIETFSEFKKRMAKEGKA